MNVADALRQTAFDILEDGLFVFLDDDDDDTGLDGYHSYRMSIEGCHKAEVGIRSEPGFSRQLAAGMLGMDEDEIDEGTARASAAEALNILAGQVVALVAGSAAELELRPPIPGGSPHGHVVTFRSEGGRVALWYAL